MSFQVRGRTDARIALIFFVALVAAPGAQDRQALDLAQPVDYVPGEILVKFVPGTPPGIANQALGLLAGRRLGEPWIAYRGAGKNNPPVRVMRRARGSWFADTVELSSNRHNSLAFDPTDGLPKVAYHTDDGLVP